MNSARINKLEVISRVPQAKASAANGENARKTPLLFVHGAYTAAWCWDEHFLPFFAESGYFCHAVSLSGHGASRGREHLDSFGIDQYVEDVAEVVAKLPAAPVLIGHSMGGIVAQKYLERHEAPAVVLMASVPPQGLWGAALGIAFQKPGLLRDLNNLLDGTQVSLETLREAMFSQPIDESDLARFYRRMQPESHRAIWDMTLFNLPLRSRMMHLPPFLVLGAQHDHLIPSSQVEMTARTYGVEAEIFPDMGHGLMLERDWRKVALRILAWLGEQGL